jgi:hypothetical protein
VVNEKAGDYPKAGASAGTTIKGFTTSGVKIDPPCQANNQEYDDHQKFQLAAVHHKHA